MTRFRVLTVFMVLGLATASPAFGQATGSAASSTAAGAGTITQNFLSMERAALQREFRVVNRCITNARENLKDIQGNVNRIAQTDLVNCSRRLQQLLRDEARLAKITARRAAEADAASQLIEVIRQRSGGSQTGQ